MANNEHLKLLTHGVDHWNEWRKTNPNIIPDLSDANFRGNGFMWANFSDSNFKKADLTGAHLVRTNFCNANMQNANLDGVEWRKSQCSRVDLKCASLRNANLEYSYFDNANFEGTNLSYTYFNVNSCDNAKFYNAILKGVHIPDEEPVIGISDDPSIFSLARAKGINKVDSNSLSEIVEYLNRAFNSAHNESLSVKNYRQGFLEESLEKVKSWKKLFEVKETFPDEIIEIGKTINSELIKYLKKNPKLLYKIQPRLFEELIAEILSSFGWKVNLTKSTRDGGYDIFAISKDDRIGAETSWLIECKRYDPRNKVGIDIVRALYGVKADLRVANMMLATTSHFSKDVHAFKASRYDLSLYDYEGILEWLNIYKPNPTGKLYIENNQLIFPNSNKK